MPIKAKVDTSKIDRAKRGLSPDQAKKILKQGGRFMLRIQDQRIFDKGMGSDGKKMKRYSTSYRAIKLESGRQVGFRDLQWTTQMRFARVIRKLTAKDVTIGWPADEAAVRAQANQNRTPFVKPTKDENKRYREFVDTMVRKAVKTGSGPSKAAAGSVKE